MNRESRCANEISTSVEVPLSKDSKRVLHLAVEEAEYLGHRHVGTEHLLLGLTAVEPGMAAELLKARGVRADEVRERIRNIETYKNAPDARVRQIGTFERIADNAQLFLQRFLEKLRAGMNCEYEEFFASQAQHIDASGALFLGRTFAAQFKELLAPFMVAEARYEQEATLQPWPGMWFATLLWGTVEIPCRDTNGRVRMHIVVTPDRSARFGWSICAIQVTPVVRD